MLVNGCDSTGSDQSSMWIIFEFWHHRRRIQNSSHFHLNVTKYLQNIPKISPKSPKYLQNIWEISRKYLGNIWIFTLDGFDDDGCCVGGGGLLGEEKGEAVQAERGYLGGGGGLG